VNPELVPDPHLVILSYILVVYLESFWKHCNKIFFQVFSSCKVYSTADINIIHKCIRGGEIQFLPSFRNFLLIISFWEGSGLAHILIAHIHSHRLVLIIFHCFTNENILFWIVHTLYIELLSFTFKCKKHTTLFLTLCVFCCYIKYCFLLIIRSYK